MDNRLMLFKEINEKEFDFDSLIGEKGYALLSGIPVKIDRIIRDVTRTTVIAISGTFVLKGVKIRGVWDMFGNIVEVERMLTLLSPRSYYSNLFKEIGDYPKNLFNLVHIQEVGKE